MLIKSQIDIKLDAEILSALAELDNHEKTSEEYETIAKRISELHKLRTDNRSRKISSDTALVVAANIFGILWLARYERENVIKSPSAFRSIMRP